MSFKLCERLDDLFPDSTQARLRGLDLVSDEEIWTFARDNDFVLVTQDADFAELAAHYGPPPKVVWLRIGNSSTKLVEAKLRYNARLIEEFVADGDLYVLTIT
ncbi:DUF5615 family PIN-like protein [Jiella sp. CBK1P-4]|uniref:DUF5615 family PIN-like protein n=1 Tax=Jiella avicenniae TaxID=2907202 RepID=A0A9X1P7V2_9HYPH|nr:DUF5615 family PIN-like protein [Jiella avicenniae]MCE7030903.1 DUF5615 family PIN-like protein [Jiella avicenniae]